MRQIGLFLFLLTLSALLSRTEAQTPDSLTIFEEITDIEKLIIHRGAAQTPPTQPATPPAQPAGATRPPQTGRTLRMRQPVQANDSAYRFSSLRFTNKTPLDSLYRRKPNGTLLLPDRTDQWESMEGLTFSDTLFYNPLFLPMIFTGKILPPDLSFYSPSTDSCYRGLLISPQNTFEPQLKHAGFINRTRRDFYSRYPDRVKLSALNFDSLPADSDEKEVIENFNPFRELISTETNFSLDAPRINGVRVKRKYWVYNGEHSLQFSQSYFSPNWHKGGVSNFNIVNNHVVKMNYKRDKIRFNNTLEWRLSVNTAPDDTIHQFRIGDDLIRYFGDFGVDAFHKSWSYSSNVDVRSQLFHNYPANSNELRSAFLAPLYVNAGIGLKYALDKKSAKVRHRRVRLDLHLDPISFGYRYVGNNEVDVTRYGIDQGERSNFDIGSTVSGTFIYDFNRYITLNSRLRYFTSYHKVDAELENTLNMALTNAFSTRLFLYLRYDDSVPPDPKFKYLQITQMLSFGLNYKW